MTQNDKEIEPNASASLENVKQVEVAVELWKKTVDVQQHFNDIELRIRNLAITVLGGLFSVAGLILKDARTSLLPGFVVLLGGALAAAFYFMDRWWYHRLLHGAVKTGQDLETFIAAKADLGDIGLAHAIKKASPIALTTKRTMRSDRKIDLFYASLVGVTIVFAAGLFIVARAAASTPKLPSVAPTNTRAGPAAPNTQTVQGSRARSPSSDTDTARSLSDSVHIPRSDSVAAQTPRPDGANRRTLTPPHK